MSTDSEAILVREATASDVSDILALIKELCYYEGEEPEKTVTVTESDLLEDGFGCDACYGCIVAEDISEKNTTGPKVVGHALYSKSYSAWKGRSLYLDDFFIKESYRRRGIGKRMMKKLAEVALENKCKLVFFTATNGNVPAGNLYEMVGSTTIDRWRVHYWEYPEMQSFIDRQEKH